MVTRSTAHRASQRVAAFAAAVATVALAACGAAATSTNAEAGRSPAQVLADAQTALRGVHSYHLAVTGAPVSQPSATVTISIDVAGPETLSGTLTVQGITAHLIYAGGARYLQGQDFLTLTSGAAVAETVGTGWAKLSTAQAAVPAEFAQPAQIAACVLGAHGSLTSGGSSTVAGHPAVRIVEHADRPGTSPATLDVAATGTPYPLLLRDSGPPVSGTLALPSGCAGGSTVLGGYASGSLTMSNFNATFKIAAPKNAVVIG